MSDNKGVRKLKPCSDAVAGDNMTVQVKFSKDSTTKILELTKLVEAKEKTIELFQVIIQQQQIMLQILSIQIATDQRKEALRQHKANNGRKRKIDHEGQEMKRKIATLEKRIEDDSCIREALEGKLEDSNKKLQDNEEELAEKVLEIASLHRKEQEISGSYRNLIDEEKASLFYQRNFYYHGWAALYYDMQKKSDSVCSLQEKHSAELSKHLKVIQDQKKQINDIKASCAVDVNRMRKEVDDEYSRNRELLAVANGTLDVVTAQLRALIGNNQWAEQAIAVQKRFQESLALIARLSKKHQDHFRQNVAATQKIKDCRQDEINQIKAAMEEMKNDHKDEISRIRASHGNDILRLLKGSVEYRKSREDQILREHELATTKLKEEHVNEMCQMKESYESRVGRISQKHDVAVASLKAEHYIEINRMKESHCKGTCCNDSIQQTFKEQYETLELELREEHKTNARQMQANFDCEISRQREIFAEALKSGEDAVSRKDTEIIKMKEKHEEEIHRMIDRFGVETQRLESRFTDAQKRSEASLNHNHDASLENLRKECEEELSQRESKIKEYDELCRKNKVLAENFRRSYEGALKLNAAVLANSEKDHTNVIRCDDKVVCCQNALLCCNIRCERYNDGSNITSGEDDRRPVIMPGDCGRSICKSCAEKDRAAKIDGLPGNAKMIQCMFCRSKYHSEKHVFPINRDLMALL